MKKTHSPQAKICILGLDPGTRHTGFAVLSLTGPHVSLVDMGVLKARPKDPLEQRLFVIGDKLKILYQKQVISETALERVFLGKNPDSAFKLGQAFGLCVYQAILHGSLVVSYPARSVKLAVTGSGRADKLAVKNFVLNRFNIKPEKVAMDATDALAVALCHTYYRKANNV